MFSEDRAFEPIPSCYSHSGEFSTIFLPPSSSGKERLFFSERSRTSIRRFHLFLRIPSPCLLFLLSDFSQQNAFDYSERAPVVPFPLSPNLLLP